MVTTWNMIQVHHKRINSVLAKTFMPRESWKELGGAVCNDDEETELPPLIDLVANPKMRGQTSNPSFE